MVNKMKVCLLITLIFFLSACNEQSEKIASLEKKIDSLENKLNKSYKPGFGEFMSNIQIHHAKLWFAGKEKNWDLADFEIHEIIETVDAIKEYETEREESKNIEMINPALVAVTDAISKKDPSLFNSSYHLLTNSCNNCHKAVNFGFNIVKIPETPPFSNQSFK